MDRRTDAQTHETYSLMYSSFDGEESQQMDGRTDAQTHETYSLMSSSFDRTQLKLLYSY